MRAFTTSYGGISRELYNTITVVNKIKNIKKEYKALWDTGATDTIISKKVVEECGLIPTSRTSVDTAGGTVTANRYFVDLILPDNIKINNLMVPELVLSHSDLLIGMDIINKGDFSVSNYEGQTKFTFRIPSMAHSDHVENQTIIHSKKKQERNSLCSCGSGKKYKNCHGK